jgi:hypothetical protein
MSDNLNKILVDVPEENVEESISTLNEENEDDLSDVESRYYNNSRIYGDIFTGMNLAIGLKPSYYADEKDPTYESPFLENPGMFQEKHGDDFFNQHIRLIFPDSLFPALGGPSLAIVDESEGVFILTVTNADPPFNISDCSTINAKKYIYPSRSGDKEQPFDNVLLRDGSVSIFDDLDETNWKVAIKHVSLNDMRKLEWLGEAVKNTISLEREKIENRKIIEEEYQKARSIVLPEELLAEIDRYSKEKKEIISSHRASVKED